MTVQHKVRLLHYINSRVQLLCCTRRKNCFR